MRTATEKEIQFINKNRSKGTLKAEDVYVEPFLLANTSFVAKYSMFMHPKAVKQMADKAGRADTDGLNFKVMHDRYKVISMGKSFAGAFDKKTATAYAKFYFPKGHSENGYSTDDLVKGLETGVYSATSWGLPWPIKEKSIKCSLCGGNPLWFRTYLGGDGKWCGHWPGDKYQVTEAVADFLKKMKTEGMDSYPNMTIKEGDEIECRMWMMDTEDKLDELSLVDRGASDSRSVREDEVSVRFSVAKEHPAFKLAADKGEEKDIKALLKESNFEIDTPFTAIDDIPGEDDDKKIDPGVSGDIKVLGEQKSKQSIGGENKVKDTLKKILGLGLKAAVDGEGGDETTNQIVAKLTEPSNQADVERLKNIETVLTAAGFDGKDLPAFLAGLKAHEDNAKKYLTVPEDIRTKIEDTTLTWAVVADYVKTCQKELDTVCTDLAAAAVAAKGNEVKEEDLKAEVVAKSRAFGLEAAIDFGRKMIETYKGAQTVKPGQKTDPSATTTDDEAAAKVKNDALIAMAKEAVKKMNKN